MKQFWQLWESRFSDKTCDRIINLCKLYPETIGLTGQNPDPSSQDKNVRSSNIRWIDPLDKDLSDLFLDIDDMFWQANRNVFGLSIDKTYEYQFTEYDKSYNGHYNWHNDVIWDSPLESHRKLSMIIQLSDPSNYEGGDLMFDFFDRSTIDDKVLKKRGTVIIFPSIIPHKVSPVTEGHRCSFVIWKEGPKWR